ncbi:citrate lyase subunit beta/citryl-CoA lyase [Microbacterium resistens]|uniref:Citrate lyase subunit beta/citryl-CoA lyase n=1 Tax=Microbacterium resistens TaxID=156977 RepID=A0ABU1SF41_9MICO|nr:CoA ester lyase [Microbacterium resistens]MDR6868235.1 citrate lyase subunit beta/citryl-CoA lyase [Microbacterium resistens]
MTHAETAPWDRGPALLFCPADRPERYASAATRADAAIIDLEDAVLPEAKAEARQAILDADLDPRMTIVRINPLGTADADEDLRMLARTTLRWVMVAKAESAVAFDAIEERYRVIALCETALGVQAAPEIARHERVAGLMWGAEDLLASLGGTSSRRADRTYRDIARFARAGVLLATGAAGKAAIDAVHLDIDDLDGLAEEATDAAASGFRATACIHPKQAPVIRAAYRPSDEELGWAQDVLAAAESESGVFRFGGRMVDEPVLRHARSLLARAGG